ncbi:hypothetical protein JK364_50880 [Streptomyces sp. 110]|uniref:Uncharacterized protein n=1 Tax=Streptomyces endocoffeicus TaxID=2898945 RepID=A0ABS1Q7A7_9ACTN|nr:hypothetical protein [Streptomyces endocoffeicus]MBL1120544.1 hypothetical protein [Streptomyces endocoffeicus]
MLALRLDGKRAAENTIHPKETVGLLTSLPPGKVDWKAPETDDEVDFRHVPGRS